MEMTEKIEKRNIADLIDEIGSSPTCLSILLFIAALGQNSISCVIVYMTEFIGTVPKFYCLSDRCETLTTQYDAVGKSVSDVICKDNLTENKDFLFDKNTTSYILDFNLYCDPSKASLLASCIFLGSLVSIVVGMYVFDAVGRRRGAAVCAMCSVFATFLGTFCNSYTYLIVIRIVQGIALYASFNGCYVWILEFIPSKYRIYYNTYSMLMWCAGYPILILTAYFIRDWRYLHLAISIISFLIAIPLLLLPNSPRYLLSAGKASEAKGVLKQYAKCMNKSLALEGVVLFDVETDSHTLSLKHRVLSFFEHKAMLVETIVLIWGWLNASLLYYGLNYGWSSFGDSPYLNYTYVAIGETAAYIVLIALTRILGRKMGVIASFGGAALCFLIGMIEWQWTEVWNLERLVSLLAMIMISMAFALLFLYTGEIAPTTHRGGIFSACSISGISAFLGPFLSTVSEDHKVRLGLCAALAGSVSVLFLLEPETRDKPIPEKPSEVLQRRKNQKLGPVCLTE